jgi:hypothetical protein
MLKGLIFSFIALAITLFNPKKASEKWGYILLWLVAGIVLSSALFMHLFDISLKNFLTFNHSNNILKIEMLSLILASAASTFQFIFASVYEKT